MAHSGLLARISPLVNSWRESLAPLTDLVITLEVGKLTSFTLLAKET
jgi:hypothetical protein